MPNTWPKLPLQVKDDTNSFLSLFERDWPEGANQTFPVGAPLKLVSGLTQVFVNPTDAPLAAFSLSAGQNTTGATTQVVLAVPYLEIEGNFLGAAAADNVLAAADLGSSRDLASDANLLGTGEAGWYIKDSAADPAVVICGFLTDQVLPTVNDTNPAAGDTNARVRARVLKGKSLFF
jgi:hypothetical protein